MPAGFLVRQPWHPWLVLLCAGLTGCAALLPAVILPQVVATVGVAAASGVACAADPLCEAQASRCSDAAGRKIEVTESSDIGFPADEGKVTTFMDRFTFGQRQHIDRLDSVATTTAATELKARIAAARGAGKN